ncbi:HAD family phosphatase [Streptomyces sp. NPDC000594]|uniref:HAD family hydrolase n=1 Tax=Streptomyces sp. NPDC000594 TaxID=3154261 RepID=UPI00332DEC06
MAPSALAVVFDHDGTLVDTVGPDFDACAALCAEFGVVLSPRLWADRICGHPDGLPELFARLRAAGRTGDDDTALHRRLEAQWVRVFDPGRIRLLPGVLELLDSLRDLGVRLAVASAADRHWVLRWLDHFAITDRFETVVAGDEVPHRKPHPDAYLEAAARLGLAPERCVAVEDSRTGVEAARAAGMTVVAVPTATTRHCDYGRAHHLLPGGLPTLRWPLPPPPQLPPHP